MVRWDLEFGSNAKEKISNTTKKLKSHEVCQAKEYSSKDVQIARSDSCKTHLAKGIKLLHGEMKKEQLKVRGVGHPD